MLYIDFMNKVKQFALVTDEDTGVTYVRPDYEHVIVLSELKLEDVSDFKNLSMDTIHRHLTLECEMMNSRNNKMPIVAQWLYSVITTVVEPTLVDEQNQIIKDLLAYRKERNAIDERTKELDHKQQMLAEKSKVSPFMFGMNFSKKKP